jgi:hypothetical protein
VFSSSFPESCACPAFDRTPAVRASAYFSDINIGAMLMIVPVRWKDRFCDSEVFALACGLSIHVFQIMLWSLSLCCTNVIFSLLLVYSVFNKAG